MENRISRYHCQNQYGDKRNGDMGQMLRSAPATMTADMIEYPDHTLDLFDALVLVNYFNSTGDGGWRYWV